MNKKQKVLILGSGALKIGEAGEFDYSGSQAIKSLKEEGIETILVNPNIATIQTSKHLADKVYFLPVNSFFVEQIIKKERPDSILLSFGGQTALNCGLELYKKKILSKYNVVILGTPIQAIILTEDRDKFANHMIKNDFPVPKSKAVTTVKEAKEVMKDISFPVMVRAAYTLGGQKSGIATNGKELEKRVFDALSIAPQVLIEQYLYHFKELEYEVVRDKFDNCITVCNMENMDPMGIHTGESIVTAPSQTLTNYEYHALRDAAIRIVRSLGIIGECNVQFALNPHQKENIRLDYYVIEVNARLSRSSALASKATGYPLAYVASKLVLGKALTEVKNHVTKVTQACFEPALDYIVVKIPRWDLEKFKGAEEQIGSSMKSVGEVMGIGRTFEEAVQKAVRMLDIGVSGVTDNGFPKEDDKLLFYIKNPTPRRIFALCEAIKRGISIDKIHEISGIDLWFLNRLKKIVEKEQELVKSKKLNEEILIDLKQLGFSDSRIGEILHKSETSIRKFRKSMDIIPSVFQIDTLAGEFPAKTNYLYTTYCGSHNDVEPLQKKGVMVLGSGPYRIGSSVEFDWTCVNTAMQLRKYGKKPIIINCNPETVSTDYDISDRLYFEELTFERIADIYEFENSYGTIISVGGQTPNNLAKKLVDRTIPILGTKANDIDKAEDRSKFSKLCDTLKIHQPEWNKFSDIKQAILFSNKVGYPVLIRPSYVLSGSAMSICYTDEELRIFLDKAAVISKDYPIIVSKFIIGAREIEFDGVGENGEIQVYAISEHIEHAGVHSGDASVVYPPQRVYMHTAQQIIEISQKLTSALKITGPFNVQYLVKDNDVMVIELNLRASRTFPFISKATGRNFAKITTDAFFRKSKVYPITYPSYAVVKVPQFSFARLEGADPILRVEMASTGEVACFSEDVLGAYMKSLFSVGIHLNNKNALLSIGGMANKELFLESAFRLKNCGYRLYATKKTHEYLKRNRIKTILVNKVYENKHPNVLDLVKSKKVSLVVSLNEKHDEESNHYKDRVSDGYLIRRAAVDVNTPLFTDINSANFFIKALSKYKISELSIKSWDEYVVNTDKKERG